MVDGISWNPFTQKALTQEEIDRLDLNKNGIVEDSEFDAGMAWLSGAQDAEGEVSIESDNSLFGKAVVNGMSRTAKTEAEFKNNMSLLKDEYIEAYLNSNPGLTDGARTTIINLINTATTEFINAEIQKNPQSFPMEQIAKDYQAFVDDAIVANNAALRHVNNQVDGYTNNMDTSYDAMVTSASLASENNYITTAEWGKVRNSTVSYLMGALMNSEDVSALLSGIDPKYSKNTYYQDAVKAINELKSCNDPAKIQQLLTTAQNNITKFLESIGADSVIGAINDMTKAKEENAITAELNKVADKWVEEQCTKAFNENGVALPSEQISDLKSFAQTTLAKFMASLEENGRLDSANMNELLAEFTEALNKDYESFTALKDDLKVYDGEIETAQQNLVGLSDSAKASGNVTEEEKAELVKAGAELIYQQLLAGTGAISLLQALNPNYANTTEFKDIQALATKLKTCTDPAEIPELQEQLKTKLEKLLSAYSGQQLVNAVDGTKPIEILPNEQRHALDSSSIGGDYDENVSRTSSYGRQTDERLHEIQEQAKKDIAAYVEALKVQLKAELGSAYDDAAIDAIALSATNDTISLFTQNVKRYGDDDYKVANDVQAFCFERRSGTKKGRYCYNLQSLINTFTDFFNAAAKVYNAEKNDPSKITYDKEDVIADSLGNEYNRNDRIKSGDETVLRAKARTKLMSVAAQIQAQLASKGCQLPSSQISLLLDESIQETLENLEIKSQADYDFYTFKNGIDYHYVNTKEIVDTFLQIFDAKLEKEKEAYKADEKKPEE